MNVVTRFNGDSIWNNHKGIPNKGNTVMKS